MLVKISKKKITIVDTDGVAREVKLFPCPTCYSYELTVIFKDEAYQVFCAATYFSCPFLTSSLRESSWDLAIESWNDKWNRAQDSRRKACKKISRERII